MVEEGTQAGRRLTRRYQMLALQMGYTRACLGLYDIHVEMYSRELLQLQELFLAIWVHIG